MKVLILGGAGMLGHRLWLNLRDRHDVWVTVRGTSHVFDDKFNYDSQRVITQVNALRFDDVVRTIGTVQPDVVVNCIGVIKQHPLAKEAIPSLEINSVLPHRLAELCKAARCRLIHISTDCVFSGKTGGYTEDDVSDAEDLYGRSKFLGEVHSERHVVTLRTSIIGPELHTHFGLLEWFLSQSGPVSGFQKAIYTGFTTDELSRIIDMYVLPNDDLHGLYQVASEPINKYELLRLFNQHYHQDLTIGVNDEFMCDRSLNADRFNEATGYNPPDWSAMVAAMAANNPYLKD